MVMHHYIPGLSFDNGREAACSTFHSVGSERPPPDAVRIPCPLRQGVHPQDVHAQAPRLCGHPPPHVLCHHQGGVPTGRSVQRRYHVPVIAFHRNCWIFENEKKKFCCTLGKGKKIYCILGMEK